MRGEAAILALALAACSPATQAQLVAQADRAMASRDWRSAAKLYAKAVQSDPSQELLIKLGRAHLEARALPSAAQAFGLALERDPRCQPCYALLGRIAIEDRQLVRAEQLLRNALHFDPADVSARNNLGFVYLLRRDLAAAYESYLQSLAFAPDDPVANLNLGRLCRDFLQDAACARKHFQRYLEVSPGGSEALEIRAWVQAQDDRGWSAVPRPKAPQDAEVGAIELGAVRSEESAEFYLEMALRWEKKAERPLELEVALRYARRALELRPSSEVQALIARLEQRLRDTPETLPQEPPAP
jgi:tetratricopeptide (TPR) repeat protein